ncbi:hypothetical protein [Delftia tsuruhatensis]|nr:hypothetical protein [Delftia tsuruhatensis]MDH1823744.1 hypothetical protein [Delftia tsuruhatensis]
MAVQVIELAVGQRWRTHGGSVVEIKNVEGTGDPLDSEYPIVGILVDGKQNPLGVSWTTEGRALGSGRRPHHLDLIELVAQPNPTPAPVPDGVDLAVESIELAAADLPNRAPDILEAAAGHMRDRAATFDKPEGERSMAQTVAIFNQFHGAGMTEAQGWHFMQILKDVRLFTRAGYHRDSGEDCVAYAALKCEAKAREGGAAC